jgi:hypothetical protein
MNPAALLAQLALLTAIALVLVPFVMWIKAAAQ